MNPSLHMIVEGRGLSGLIKHMNEWIVRNNMHLQNAWLNSFPFHIDFKHKTQAMEGCLYNHKVMGSMWSIHKKCMHY